MSKSKKLYIPKNCRIIKGKRYERLFNHPSGEKYRVFLSDDDYDYISEKYQPFGVAVLDAYFRITKR